MKDEIIDITFPVNANMPIWPGSIGYRSKWQMRMPKDGNNLSSIEIDNHFGTHLDAPKHFIENGKSIHQLDLDKMIGEVFVVEIRGTRSIGSKELEEKNIPVNCQRLIIKTDNQDYWNKGETEFQKDFCALDESGAKWIVERNMVLIGIDYLSIQRFEDGPQTHQILLGSEVIIVESLNLAQVFNGWYQLICLPIKLEGLEGAPVRAVLKKARL